jgi:hypothetical protein
MGKTLTKEINAALFRMKWTFMSHHQRYAYLWQQTQNGQLRKGISVIKG